MDNLFLIIRVDRDEDEEIKDFEIYAVVEKEDTAIGWVKKLNDLESVANAVFSYSGNWEYKPLPKISRIFFEPHYIKNARKIMETKK